MTELAQMKCVACRKDAPRMTTSEISEWMPKLPQWKVLEHDGILRLERVFKFPDFATAIKFTNKVADAAEAENHHPALLTEWGKVTVSWWTHKIKGLHKNDFIMAARTDEVYS
ncbi:MAG: 4a-hydroxytetrahydrobiopterin dehydratase [Acidobacteria bacterium]|nr:MAG: 4a-hydroxytetrahydrobiopterin dehydratase [Acidobacteriota bacterium]